MAMKNRNKPIRTELEKQHAREADKGAKFLVEKLRDMNRPEAEKYVSENLPTVGVIVGMAFYRQREASKQRRPNDLQKLIEDIAADLPTITAKQLLEELRKERGNGVIESINDDEGKIEWNNRTRVADTPISALKDRLYRAKKILSC
jgi:hypothetical protein